MAETTVSSGTFSEDSSRLFFRLDSGNTTGVYINYIPIIDKTGVSGTTGPYTYETLDPSVDHQYWGEKDYTIFIRPLKEKCDICGKKREISYRFPIGDYIGSGMIICFDCIKDAIRQKIIVSIVDGSIAKNADVWKELSEK